MNDEIKTSPESRQSARQWLIKHNRCHCFTCIELNAIRDQRQFQAGYAKARLDAANTATEPSNLGEVKSAEDFFHQLMSSTASSSMLPSDIIAIIDHQFAAIRKDEREKAFREYAEIELCNQIKEMV